MLNEIFYETLPILLDQEDLNCMHHSIENRAPFLDRQMAEFVFSIPTENLINKGGVENKWNIVAPKSGRVKMVSEILDSAVMPGIQGGPLMHIIAAKAIAFGEALDPSFKIYAQEVINNAQTMAAAFSDRGYDLISGGTDTHVVLIDLSNKNVNGKVAEKTLEKAGITINKNMVPFDTKSPFITSGIRVGTPAITTRGMGIDEMDQIVDLIDQVISNIEDESIINIVNESVKELCQSFPLYNELHQ